MLERIQDLFEDIKLYELGELEQLPPEHLHLICNVLLLHVAFLDLSFPDSEQQSLIRTTMQRSLISEKVAEHLCDLAEVIRVSSGKRNRFLDILAKHLTHEEKLQLYTHCWEIILADNKIKLPEQQAASILGQRLGLTFQDELGVRQRLFAEATR